MSEQSPAWPAWLSYGQAETVQDLDVAFGRLLAEQCPDAPQVAVRLAMQCCAQLAQGHPCLDLRTLADRLPLAPDECLAQLEAAPFVGDGGGDEPLVLHGARLYLARYWRAGERIRQAIAGRLGAATDALADPPLAREWLDRLFRPEENASLDWQKLACAVMLGQRFGLITGGPGTGKTTTVVRLLAVLQGLAQARGLARGLRIRLAAPTGKAAARLNESIAGKLQDMAGKGGPELRAALDCVPSQVVTLHRLLGSRPGTRRMSHHAGRPLDLDVLVIDEASMMDIEMADAVLSALPAAAQLVLLGDKDQLASVEAGAVLGELCARAEGGHYTRATCERLAALCGQDLMAAAEDPGRSGVEAGVLRCPDPDGTPLDQAVIMLRRSMRFGKESGIGRFAHAVNRGQVAEVRALLQAGLEDLDCVASADAAGADAWLRDAGVLADAAYPAIFTRMQTHRPAAQAPQEDWDRWALDLLGTQARFQVLCAVRQGPWGVQGLNQLIESRLRSAGLIPSGSGPWYPGQPVLVRRNLPALGLANGDMGLVLSVPAPGRPEGRLRAAFAGARQGTVRWVSPARLADAETAYALTVHKSQGSEFERVVLVLPDRPGPLVTRELLYTGATRARKSLTLVLPHDESIVHHAVRHPTRRAGGVWNP
ncbi:exodeoxyribonuclease V subunit alpha [uncultured Castellaniella sp.]|uniref:exodeoxyribonuclease V subunit alpha n=1 Tax=uncultured Castellaniella sp. TaxID=647907 RepID=UPI00261B5806|nr:exodeoxyribonuclease V subunit alpha [uncultured Castellaniella sp.]